MPYTRNTWVNEILAADPRYDIFEDGGGAFKTDMQIELATTVTQAGTALNAARMNNIEGELQIISDLLLYKFSVTVVSNDLVVTLQHSDGTNPTSTRPLYFRIGGVWRAVTTTTTITIADGTNWFNSGSVALGTLLVGYFPYVVWDSNSSVVALSIARIPFGRLVSDFSTTTTNEKHLYNFTNFTSTDPVANIGYFEATLSLTGTGHLWTVPTFTNANLIFEPTEETRWLTWTPVYSASGSLTYTSVTSTIARYKISNAKLDYVLKSTGTLGGTASTQIEFTMPFEAAVAGNPPGGFGVTATVAAKVSIINGTPDGMRVEKYDTSNYANSGTNVINVAGFYEI